MLGGEQFRQAGLPQGSSQSQILFLFFIADLVQHRLDRNGGSIAFVDDYTAWVTGPSAEANQAGIQGIIDQALQWERRSGAAFEGEKTTLVYSTRNTARTSDQPIVVKGQDIYPTAKAKILGVVLDSELRYKHKSRYEWPPCHHGVEETEGSVTIDGVPAVRGDDGAGRGLRLERVDAFVRELCHCSIEQSTEDKSAGRHRLLSDRSDSHRRGRSKPATGPGTIFRET